MASEHLDQSLADKMVNEAVRVEAEAKFHGSVPRTLQEIQQGNCEVCGGVSDCIAHQVGAYLGQMDRTVKAVFKYEPESATTRPVSGAESLPLRKGGINMVAWVTRKSAAFNSLSSTLESVISERRRKIHCKSALAACYVLDIKTIEETEVFENRGLAMIANSPLVRTEQLWKRPEIKGAAESAPKETALHQPGASAEAALMEVLFSEALAIEGMPDAERPAFEPRLQEIKVDLIRRLLSDQPRYIAVARQWLTVGDLLEITRRKIGSGPVGGEAAGLILARRILQNELPEPLKSSVHIPESFYLGADLFYAFMAKNQLMRWNYQKYKPEQQIRSEYPLIRDSFRAGDFPEDVLHELKGMLHKIGSKPLIVRSSSLLEDSFGSAFAGKYEFVLCPNQGAPEENLRALVQAIASVYASTLCPEALLYRQIRGLRDYDERMGVLVQPLQGERFERYFLPAAAGVALSRNLYRWAPQIRAEDGFVRLVWGLATSAVERSSNNPPRLVALSHPGLQPTDPAHPEWSFCQQFVDVVDLVDNRCKTLPVHDVISPNYPPIRLIAMHKEADYFTPLHGRLLQADIPSLAITFDEFLAKTEFAAMLKKVLHTLEAYYEAPVDVGFTVQILDMDEYPPELSLSLLHCRRQGYLAGDKPAPLPASLPAEKVAFKTRFMVPRGAIDGIRHVVFVTPEGYDRMGDPDQEDAGRDALRQAIYQLNAALGEKQFICVGPGAWGAANPRLGVPIDYADIHNAAALVELYGLKGRSQPDPALGTYAFQDLMEAAIYPLTVSLDQPEAGFNRAFFYETPSRLGDFLKVTPELEGCLRLIEIAAYAPGCHLAINMDDEKNLAVAYFRPDKD